MEKDSEERRSILYCILVHDQPKQTQRLLRALSNERDCCVVHVDGKSPDDYRELIASFVSGLANTHLIPSRVCAWGGTSLVEASLDMLQFGMNVCTRWSHALLLSGTHLPLWSSERIRNWLRPDSSVMRYYQLPDRELTATDDWIGRMWARIEFGYDEIRGNRMQRGRHLGRPDFPYAVGSQWVGLARAHVQFILQQRHSAVSARLLSSNVPDESYFQSMLLSSPFSDQRLKSHTTMVTFIRGASNPKVLSLDDYLGLVVQGELPFARKFMDDLGADADVNAAIQAVMRGSTDGIQSGMGTRFSVLPRSIP